MIRYYDIAGCKFVIDTDFDFTDTESTAPFAADKDENAVRCIFRLTDDIPLPEGNKIYNSDAVRIYDNKGQKIRTYKSPLMPREAAVIKEKNGIYYILLDKTYAIYFSRAINLMNALGTENLFIEKNMLVLHCSFIELNGEAILFSGPSGAGKSTRADMWIKHTGARLINGDKAVLFIKNGRFYASGLPVAGSSELFLNEAFPLKSIVFLDKCKINNIYSPDAKTAISRLFKNITVNICDEHFINTAAEIITRLCEEINIYVSECDLSSASVEQQLKTIIG